MYVHACIAMSSSVGSVVYGVLNRNREMNTLLQVCCSSSLCRLFREQQEGHNGGGGDAE